MIKNIYIIRENGILLYHKRIIGMDYDNDVLVGFFSSIVNFGHEALRTVVKTVEMGGGNKVLLFVNRDEGLMGAAITDSFDNNNLVHKILRNIIQEFADRYAPDYDMEDIKGKVIDITVRNELMNKVTSKLKMRVFISWLLLTSLTLALVILGMILKPFYTSLVDVYIIYILIIIPLPNIISGYIIASRRFVLVNPIVSTFTSFYFGYIFGVINYSTFVSLSNILSILFSAWIFSYIGFKISASKRISR